MASGAPRFIYLGPQWSQKARALTLLHKFLEMSGGYVATSDLQALYAQHPWLKNAVGQLRDFAKDIWGLSYLPRQGKRSAALLCVAASSRSVQEQDGSPESNSFCSMPLRCRHSTGRRHDGKQHKAFIARHLQTAARLTAMQRYASPSPLSEFTRASALSMASRLSSTVPCGLFGGGSSEEAAPPSSAGMHKRKSTAAGFTADTEHGSAPLTHFLPPTRRTRGKCPGVPSTPVAAATMPPPTSTSDARSLESPFDKTVSMTSSDQWSTTAPQTGELPMELQSCTEVLFELGLLSPLRGGVANPTLTTCFLGSLLQALLQAVSVEALLEKHASTEACGEGCSWCLLKEANRCTLKTDMIYDPSSWSPFFDRRDKILIDEQKWKFGSRQHDPVEVWQSMREDKGDRSPPQQHDHAQLVAEVFGCQIRSVIWSQYHCVCPGIKSVPKDKEEFSTHIELAAPPMQIACSLSELLDRESNAEPIVVDGNPPCPICGVAPANCRTLHIVKAQEILMISLNRCTIVQEERAGQGPVFKAAKLTSYVQPDSELQIGDKSFFLKAVVVHRGMHQNSGHYVCYARQHRQMYCLYDDSKPVMENIVRGLPLEACTDGRLFLYESAAHVWPNAQLQKNPCTSVTNAATASSRAGLSGPFAADPQTPPAKEEEEEEEEAKPLKFMGNTGGADQVDRDARALLQTFTEKGDACAFLRNLPKFVSETGHDMPLDSCNAHLERSIEALLQEAINSHAALDTLHYSGDCAYYPLVVLAHAAMLALGFPPTFFLDAVYTIVGSLINKDLYVQLGRYKSRSRHWMNGVAGAGEGKSPTVKPLMERLLDVLRELHTMAPGSSNDMFHTCQSTTTAAAIDKIRATKAYLLLNSDDAGRCVSVPFAQGGKTDRSELSYKNADVLQYGSLPNRKYIALQKAISQYALISKYTHVL